MLITILNKSLEAKINTKGAELVSLSKESFNYIWEIDEKFWNKTSPVLFPIVGSLKNNKYSIDGNKYSLNRHGFARDLEFELLEHEEDFALFCLKSNDETLKNYPFDFELQIKYELKANELDVTYKIINNSDIKMPFNIGAHPAFKIDYNIFDYCLEFNVLESFKNHKLRDGLFAEEIEIVKSKDNIIFLSEKLFENDALVFKNINSNSIKLKYFEKDYLIISFYNFPHVGIWKKPKAPFLCIEPWTGYTDSINSNGKIFDKESIQILNPKCFFECKIKIEV